MPIGVLATAVLGVLAPVVKKGVQAIAEKAGDFAAKKAQEVLTTLHEKFAGDPVAKGMLEMYEKSPDAAAPALEIVLKEKLRQDPALEKKLQGLIDEMGTNLKIVLDLGKVTGNVVGVEADDVARGTNVDVNVKASDVTGNVTGGKFGRIG